ncbi:IS630 family transposase [Kitasatospora sp. NPDC088783]|uniref:IS630 family transposase n=1 Tax=Kitasatospora sp. NPDC088783 TaxID=3364077 RepID=UPI00382133B8
MTDLVGDARRLSPDAQEALRMRAVAAVRAGRNRREAAELLGVSAESVADWWAAWQAGGREALVSGRRGRRPGEHQVLDPDEQQCVRQALLDHRPEDLGLGGQLWTRAMVGDLIALLYRVRLTEQGVGKYLRRWGLSFQRPDKRAIEQGPEAVRARREETWPAIRARSAEVLSADQVGVRSDQVSGRTWAAKGGTPTIRRTGNRFSVNAMSAISTRGKMWFTAYRGSSTTTVFLDFLRRLVGQFDRKTHLVVDRHSVHRGKAVREWLAEHEDRIVLHLLPAYAPETDPDELVNADLKRTLLPACRARNAGGLADEVRRFFHRRQNQPRIVRGYFRAPHVRYILDAQKP